MLRVRFFEQIGVTMLRILAAPITCMAGGKQYIVLAVGGERCGRVSDCIFLALSHTFQRCGLFPIFYVSRRPIKGGRYIFKK